jgi:hypothetical protein
MLTFVKLQDSEGDSKDIAIPNMLLTFNVFKVKVFWDVTLCTGHYLGKYPRRLDTSVRCLLEHHTSFKMFIVHVNILAPEFYI